MKTLEMLADDAVLIDGDLFQRVNPSAMSKCPKCEGPVTWEETWDFYPRPGCAACDIWFFTRSRI